MSLPNFTPEPGNRYATVTKAPAGEDANGNEDQHLSIIGWLTTESRVLPVVLDPETWQGVTLLRWLDDHQEYRLVRLRRGKTHVEVMGSINAWTND